MSEQNNIQNEGKNSPFKNMVKKIPGNPFATLRQIDLSGAVEKKNGLNYIPWAVGFDKIKTYYPASRFEIMRDAHGIPYFTDGNTCWVETKITIVDDDGKEYPQSEILPILDYRHQAIKADKVDLFLASNSIRRCFAKNAALHGVGIEYYGADEVEMEEKAKVYPPIEVKDAQLTEENYKKALAKEVKSGSSKGKLWSDAVLKDGGVLDYYSSMELNSKEKVQDNYIAKFIIEYRKAKKGEQKAEAAVEVENDLPL